MICGRRRLNLPPMRPPGPLRPRAFAAAMARCLRRISSNCISSSFSFPAAYRVFGEEWRGVERSGEEEEEEEGVCGFWCDRRPDGEAGRRGRGGRYSRNGERGQRVTAMSVVTVVREVQESQQNIMIRLHIIVSLCRSAIDRRAGNHGSWAELPIFRSSDCGRYFPPFPLILLFVSVLCD